MRLPDSFTLAFLIAPLPPTVTTAVANLTADHNVSGLLWILTEFYLRALLFELMFGLPLFLVARRFNLVRWWTALSCGVVLGVLALYFFSGSGSVRAAPALMLWAASGGAAGLAFWTVWRIGDRTGRPTATVA
jgi:hypothetical protein